jgi:hypothetical protein
MSGEITTMEDRWGRIPWVQEGTHAFAKFSTENQSSIIAGGLLPAISRLIVPRSSEVLLPEVIVRDLAANEPAVNGNGLKPSLPEAGQLPNRAGGDVTVTEPRSGTRRNRLHEFAEIDRGNVERDGAESRVPDIQHNY